MPIQYLNGSMNFTYSHSKQYRDNWEATFGKREEEDSDTEQAEEAGLGSGREEGVVPEGRPVAGDEGGEMGEDSQEPGRDE